MPVPPPLKISVLRPAAFIASRVVTLPSSPFSARSLRAAKPLMCCAPPSYESRPRSFRLGSVSIELGQRDRAVARRNPAARADRHVDDDVGGDAGLLGGRRQVARVLCRHRPPG